MVLQELPMSLKEEKTEEFAVHAWIEELIMAGKIEALPTPR